MPSRDQGSTFGVIQAETLSKKSHSLTLRCTVKAAFQIADPARAQAGPFGQQPHRQEPGQGHAPLVVADHFQPGRP